MASEIVITEEEKRQAWLRSREKYELDLQSKMVYAERQSKQEGLKEGEAKGRLEGRKEILDLIKSRLKGREEGRQEILDLIKSGKSLEEILREYGTE
jgi:DNA invertase Pin-like site-specific DNA recombinase